MSKDEKMLKKILDELKKINTEIKDRCINLKSNTSLMQIPGHKVRGNEYIEYHFGEKGDIPKLGLDKLPFENLLAPTAHATLVGIEGEKSLKVFGVSFVNKEYNLNSDDFEFFYSFNCNISGEYQLDIYMTFVSNKPKKALDYSYYPFEMEFSLGSIICAEGMNVRIEEIKVVQLFLIDRDPRTSRGTETAVQPGDDED